MQVAAPSIPEIEMIVAADNLAADKAAADNPAVVQTSNYKQNIHDMAKHLLQT